MATIWTTKSGQLCIANWMPPSLKRMPARPRILPPSSPSCADNRESRDLEASSPTDREDPRPVDRASPAARDLFLLLVKTHHHLDYRYRADREELTVLLYLGSAQGARTQALS